MGSLNANLLPQAPLKKAFKIIAELRDMISEVQGKKIKDITIYR